MNGKTRSDPFMPGVASGVAISAGTLFFLPSWITASALIVLPIALELLCIRVNGKFAVNKKKSRIRSIYKIRGSRRKYIARLQTGLTWGMVAAGITGLVAQTDWAQQVRSLITGEVYKANAIEMSQRRSYETPALPGPKFTVTAAPPQNART